MANNANKSKPAGPDVSGFYNKHELPPENPQFMSDGIRRIDFVLMYEEVTNDPKKDHHAPPTTTEHDVESKKSGHHHHPHLPHHHHKKHEIDESKHRAFFEENLIKEGLQLEYDRKAKKNDDEKKKKKKKKDSKETKNVVEVYVKVHAPWPILCRWAEMLKIKMPLRLVDRFDVTKVHHSSLIDSKKRGNTRQFGWTRSGPTPVVAPSDKQQPQQQQHDDHPDDGYLEGPITGKPNFVTMPFERKRIDKFAIADPDTFFSTSQRQEIVYEVLQRARNDPEDDKKRGIEAMIEEKIYAAAYPLHDGDFQIPTGVPMEQWGNRQRLRLVWASWSSFFKRQPYELIRSYFGEKVAFYFAFLGFYTRWLLFPTITGLCVFVYGCFYPGDDAIVEDICADQPDHMGSKYACPVCKPPDCEFEKLAVGCDSAEWDYRMDNEATPVMAALTIIWATVYLKAWKRREAVLAYEWDTYDLELEDDIVRPEYEERAPARHRNFITREIEPYVPKKTRLWWKFLSSMVTAGMLLLVTVVLVVLVLARIALYGTLQRWHVPKSTEIARIFIHLVILAMVMVLDIGYAKMAEKLTSYECPRTQTQWLTSFLWKLFIFELTNDFVPIIYAAWIKGRIVKTPMDLNAYTELCEPGGCMNEVTEVIAFLLLGRLVVGNTTEIGIPFVKQMLARSQTEVEDTTATTNAEAVERRRCANKQWVHDANAEQLEHDGVAEEYMEMMVQFAFCTLFVPALPVAPLVCFVNNLLEIRVDAIKFIIHRRPLPIRSPGVQIWNNFLDIVCKLAVISNAGLIAFTSDTLPRLYFKYAKNGGVSYEGFQFYALSNISIPMWAEKDPIVEEELAHIRNHSHSEHTTASPGEHGATGGGGEHGGGGTEHGQHGGANVHETQDDLVCYYNDYRSDTYPYDVTQDWWETWTIRFAFFGMFIVVAFTFQFLYNFIVPDVPSHVRMQIQRRRYVLSKGLEQAAAVDSSEKWLKQAIHGKQAPRGHHPHSHQHHHGGDQSEATTALGADSSTTGESPRRKLYSKQMNRENTNLADGGGPPEMLVEDLQ